MEHKKQIMNINRFGKFILASSLLVLSLVARTQTQDDEQQIMKQLKGTKVERQAYQGFETYRVYDPVKLKWGLYSVLDSEEGDKGMIYELETLLPPVCDEIFWDEQMPIVIARQGKKFAFITAFNESMKATKPDFAFDDYRVQKKGSENFLLIAQNSKWGLMDYKKINPKPVIVFATDKDVPLRYMEEDEAENFRKAYSHTKANKVQFDPASGDGIFRARKSDSQKWGLFQLTDEKAFLELIPAEYDSLEFIPANQHFTIVYQQGKAGVYLSKLKFPDAKQTVACEYNTWKVAHFDGMCYLAMAEADGWGWVDWLTGDEKTDFTAASFAELPKPEFEQVEEEE